jgi:hypothetical protein
MIDLIYPFEWCMSMIPFVYNDSSLKYINAMQSIIMGIHCSAREKMYEEISDETENLGRLVIIDLTRN